MTELLANLRTGSWLEAQTFAPLRYAVPAVIPEGSSLLIGPPKIGKSFFVLALALAKASGGRALGSIRVDQAPCLYLALEDGDRRMQARARMLLGEDRIPAAFEYMTRIDPGSVVATIGEWLTRHPGEPSLVILDTLGKVMPPAQPGESAYQRDYRVGTALKRLADDAPGVALVTNHHDRKASSEDFVDSVSGTHGLAGAADTTIVLARERSSSDALLRVTGRDVIEGQYAIRFSDGAWHMEGATLAESSQIASTRVVSGGLGDQAADIVAFVGERPDGVRAADVGEALGIDAKLAADYLARLLRTGRIDKAGRGLYLPLSKVSNVQKEEEHPTLDSTVSTLSTRTVCGHPPEAVNTENGKCGLCILDGMAAAS